jgi:VanZ family protein
MPHDAEQRETENWIDRVELAIALVLQMGILVVTVSAFFQGRWLGAFSGVVVLLLTSAPAMIERRLKLTLPVEFTLINCVILYASFALGEAQDFYEKIWWWDLALHGLSALTMGMIGFLCIYVFYMTHRIDIAAGWIATITFALAVSVGTIWEVFEFLADQYLGLNMQKSGLVDTMTDLMINATGAALAALLGYFYVRDQDSLFARRVLRAWEKRRHPSIKKTQA